MGREVSARLTPREGRKFAWSIGGAFFLFGAIAWYRDHRLAAEAFGSFGAVLLLAGLIVPDRLTPVWRAWMGLARAISKVTTPVFMGLVYFLGFAPMGLAKRWIGHDALVHKAGTDGYWVQKRGARSDMERQF